MACAGALQSSAASSAPPFLLRRRFQLLQPLGERDVEVAVGGEGVDELELKVLELVQRTLDVDTLEWRGRVDLNAARSLAEMMMIAGVERCIRIRAKDFESH